MAYFLELGFVKDKWFYCLGHFIYCWKEAGSDSWRLGHDNIREFKKSIKFGSMRNQLLTELKSLNLTLVSRTNKFIDDMEMVSKLLRNN